MSKRASGALIAGLVLDRALPEPLHRQLYAGVREAILSGYLAAGARLPSTRMLAAELGVSRNTVTEAFTQLFAEGYVEGRTGAGTYVSRAVPATLRRPEPAVPPVGREAAVPRRLSRRAEAMHGGVGTLVRARFHGDGGIQPFQLGVPDLDNFPVAIWGKLVGRHGRDLQPWARGLLHPTGHPALREAVAGYLATARGVRCRPEQVIIVGGSQQGIALAAQVLLDPGDEAWMEDPGYRGTRTVLAGSGVRVVPVPVNAEGLDLAAGKARAPGARLAYVTPSHQFPLGVVMSLRRRLELLEWAAFTGAWILEDDYDSEFRYGGRPLTALQGLDTGGRVIYAGTFSKVLFPALRLGYLIVPEPLVETFASVLFAIGGPAPMLEQLVLADFIGEGHFERHLRRMRQLYRERQETLVRAAQRKLWGLLQVVPADAGMHLVGWLPEGVDDRAVAQAAAARNLRLVALSQSSVEPPERGALLLGYAALTLPQIREGIDRLGEVL